MRITKRELAKMVEEAVEASLNTKRGLDDIASFQIDAMENTIPTLKASSKKVQESLKALDGHSLTTVKLVYPDSKKEQFGLDFDVEFDEPTKAKDALKKVKREFGKYIDSDAHSDGKSIYFVVRVK